MLHAFSTTLRHPPVAFPEWSYKTKLYSNRRVSKRRALADQGKAERERERERERQRQRQRQRQRDRERQRQRERQRERETERETETERRTERQTDRDTQRVITTDLHGLTCRNG